MTVKYLITSADFKGLYLFCNTNKNDDFFHRTKLNSASGLVNEFNIMEKIYFS